MITMTNALLTYDRNGSRLPLHPRHQPSQDATGPAAGSGGNEHELVPFAADVAPGSPILAVRGGIPFDGGFVFLHRLADRSIDDADITSRPVILADFIEAAGTLYRLTRAPIAIGFSDGAIMAAALLLTRPGLLAGAILFRPLSSFRHDLPTRLDSAPLLIIDGEKDTRRSPGDGARLAERDRRDGSRDCSELVGAQNAMIEMRRRPASGFWRSPRGWR
jgi:phospholipase/carboxylesterase